MEEAARGDGYQAQATAPGADEQKLADAASGRITIQDAIWLTASFDREWFRSVDTLDADFSRFAAAYRLSAEEMQEVRHAVDVLYGTASADSEG